MFMTKVISILLFILIQTYVMNLQGPMSNAPPTYFADEVCLFLTTFCQDCGALVTRMDKP